MGDSCYVCVTLHGTIETIEVFEEVVEAIYDEFGYFSDLQHSVHRQKSLIIGRLQKAIDENSNPEFEADEVNYANIDDLEYVLKKHQIDYQFSWGEGDSYFGGNKAYFSADGSETEAINSHGDTVVLESELERVANSDDPVAALKELLERTKRACGHGLPTFSLGHEVRGWLAMGGPQLEAKKGT